jgi:hypothetical protein
MGGSMKDLFVIQFTQFWRMFESVVSNFNSLTWKESGHGLTKPYLLAYHIIQSIKYYIDDKNDVVLLNGNILSHDIKLIDCGLLISQKEICAMVKDIQPKLEKWIQNVNLQEENTRCKWTGDKVESIILFIIRHSYFHFGEMNTLLNEYLDGKAPDYFASNIY